MGLLAAAASYAASPRDWDQSLPELELQDVDLSADSLEKAWQLLGTRHLVRSILWVTAPAKTTGEFRLNASKRKVREVLDALVQAYPDFTWTADPKTSVLWIHPRTIAFGDLLAERLRVPRDACSVPLQTGVLLPLEAAPGVHVVTTRWGTAFTNTFDTAVDLPAGTYRLRDLLSLAIKPHPTKALYVRSREGHEELTAVHLGSDELTRPPEGAVLWWRLHFGASREEPTPSALAARLASAVPAERAASREYLEAIAWQIDLDALVRDVPSSPAEAVWVCAGVASVLVRTPGTTHLASLHRLEALLRKGLPARGGRPLALLAELERARLAGEKQLPARLSSIELRENEFAPILSDLLRLASLAEPARMFLEQRRSGWVATPPAKPGTWAARCLGDPARPWSSAVLYERPVP